MPVSDKNTANSPFSQQGQTARRKRAFMVVAGLAAVSCLAMFYGIYIDFLHKPTAQATFHLTQTNQDTLQTEVSLINPQPPQKKPEPSKETQGQTENADLIKQLEEEKKTMEETAVVLQEIVGAVPDSAAVQQLHQEKDLNEQKKIEQIKNLHEEQKEQDDQKLIALNDLEAALAALENIQEEQAQETLPKPEKKKEEKAAEPVAVVVPAAVPVTVPPAVPAAVKKENSAVFVSGPVEKEAQKETIPPKKKENKQTVLKLTEPVKAPPPIAEYINEAPPPDLITTTLVGSLPNFGLIKKNGAQNVIPLHIIDPLPELQTESRYGKLPVKSNDGNNTPFLAYSRPVEQPVQTPYIAILFSGLGKRTNATVAAINTLPPVVSMSFSPYADKLKNYVTDARRSGHETLLDLPMQQGTFPETDPGPLGLVAGLPEQENRKRLHKVLGQGVAFIGLTGATGENFSYSGGQMKPFIDDIIKRGLIYVSGIADARMPKFQDSLRPDVHISSDFHRAAIRVRLEEAKQKALKNGSAFLRVETVPITLLTVEEWMKSFEPTEEKPIPEITFVPLSYYAKQKSAEK